MEFSAFLAKIFESGRVNQAALARELPCHASYLAGLKSGQRPPPPAPFIERMSDVLGLPSEVRARLLVAAAATKIVNSLETNGGHIPAVRQLIGLARNIPEMSPADVAALDEFQAHLRAELDRRDRVVASPRVSRQAAVNAAPSSSRKGRTHKKPG